MDWLTMGKTIGALAGAGCAFILLLIGMMVWYWWANRKGE